MMLFSDFYPPPADVVKSELKVLNYLRDNTYIKEWHPQAARDAGTYFDLNRNSKSGFEFNSHFDVLHALMRRGRSAGMQRGRAPNVRLTISARLELVANELTNLT